MRKALKAAETRDPFMITSQSRTFANRSVLLRKVGAQEQLRDIKDVRVRKYVPTDSVGDDSTRLWYAPIAYLRNEVTAEPIELIPGVVAFVSDPLRLSNYLDNWKALGIVVADYELACALTDREFDDLIAWMAERGLSAIIDPVFDGRGQYTLARGFILEDADRMKSPKAKSR
jgi:hypothetical protein